ncbi:WD40 repeat-like protein [Dendrothele bispora CBS 962.96]|uniref:WD40 repeat-like protein n=1 Tax=Dendrothele bispora (strain CBS 962.96) TaxID=1314807 RepID=A0A4S8MIJ1_DENBC|nr:WD40 repeat-like protein [Dendrothele bispora CBS 962.96]
MVNPKTTSSTTSILKSAKKARIEEPPKKLTASRIKGSPKPTSKSRSKQPLHEVQPVPVSAKSKGKQKAEVELQSEEKNDTSIPAFPRTFKVIAGSYEKLLYGLEGSTSFSSDSDSGSENKLTFDLKPIFIFPAHVSCIKTVAASPNGGKWLATGSSDEIIKVWDLRRKKEIGGLMHHEGSITSLFFPSRSHLISASEDGTLCLFHARDWAVLRILKGHKARVNSVAVHPSGKVALSVGKDRTLRMWDLMRGKGVASTKLGKEGEVVRWSTDGSLFIVQTGSSIDIYNTAMSLLHTINHPSRIQDITFCAPVGSKEEILLVGAEDKKVSVYTVPSSVDQEPDPLNPPKVIAEMIGHSSRIKAIQTLTIALPPSPTSNRSSTTIMSSVSSDGKIHVYDLFDLSSLVKEKDGSKTVTVVEIQPVAVYDTKGTRLTCLALADGEVTSIPVVARNGKRKRGQSEDEDSSELDEDEGEEDEWAGVQDEETDAEEGEEEEEEEEEAEEA